MTPESKEATAKRWYVVNTYSGYENKVKTNLERRIASLGMEDKIFRIVIPVDYRLRLKDGKRETIAERVFPGYVLVEMVLDDESWHVVRGTPGVIGFVGSGGKPIPLTDAEVSLVLKRIGEDEAKAQIKVEIGQSVKVIEGPFEGFVGKVEQVNPDRQTVKVRLSMFGGRDIPVELDFLQVEKI
jgi:transcriptional antiterminator NusG